MKNWRTTLLGVLSGVGMMTAGAKLIMAGGDLFQGVGMIVAGAAVVLHGAAAADAKTVQNLSDEVKE